MSQARYLQTYRQNRIQTADPGTILLMLYDGAIEFVRRAISALEEGSVAEKGMCLLKAHAIISEFMASLNREVAGEMGENLEGLYVFMLDQITVANVNNDPKPLNEIVSLLTTLKEGWKGAVAAEKTRAGEVSPS